MWPNIPDAQGCPVRPMLSEVWVLFSLRDPELECLRVLRQASEERSIFLTKKFLIVLKGSLESPQEALFEHKLGFYDSG